MSKEQNKALFYTQSKEEVLKELDSSIEGLSTAQAQERLATYGHNELDEGEKVALKFSNDELVMTRFSSPKSIMRFYKNEDGGAIIPTPMGIQQFLITTDLFQLEAGHLKVSYRLLTLDGEQEFANYQLLVEWEE